MLVELARQREPSEVVIVADGDGPGRKGADNLAAVLVAYCPVVKVITPPVGMKDAREWKRTGATVAEAQGLIDAAEAWRLSVKTKQKGRQ